MSIVIGEQNKASSVSIELVDSDSDSDVILIDSTGKCDSSCDLCGELFDEKESLLKHQFRHHWEKFVCPFSECKNITYFTMPGLTDHVNSVHKLTPFPERDSLKCHLCKAVFNRKTNLPIHFEFQHVLKCGKCDKEFSSISVLEKHLLERHYYVEVDESSCKAKRPLPPVSIPRKNNERESKSYQLRCYVCEKTFRFTNSLQNHFKHFHSQLEPKLEFQCIECDQVFNVRYDIMKHINFKHPAKLSRMRPAIASCILCAYSSRSNADLIKHINQKHSTDKMDFEYKCDNCNSSFKSQYSAQLHTEFYLCSGSLENLDSDDDEPVMKTDFECDVCKHQYRNPQTLFYHQFQQHWEKFICLFCNKNVTCFTKKALEDHMNEKHGGVPLPENYNLSCHICQAQFNAKGDALTHYNARHIISCGECKTTGSFGTNLRLRKHLLKKHLGTKRQKSDIKSTDTGDNHESSIEIEDSDDSISEETSRNLDLGKVIDIEREVKHEPPLEINHTDLNFDQLNLLENHFRTQNNCETKRTSSGDIDIHIELGIGTEDSNLDEVLTKDTVSMNKKTQNPAAKVIKIEGDHKNTIVTTALRRYLPEKHFPSQSNLGKKSKADDNLSEKNARSKIKTPLNPETKSLEKHQRKESTLRVCYQFRCYICKKIFSNVHSIHQHLKLIHSHYRTKLQFECLKCEKAFNYRYEAIKHFRIKHAYYFWIHFQKMLNVKQGEVTHRKILKPDNMEIHDLAPLTSIHNDLEQTVEIENVIKVEPPIEIYDNDSNSHFALWNLADLSQFNEQQISKFPPDEDERPKECGKLS